MLFISCENETVVEPILEITTEDLSLLQQPFTPIAENRTVKITTNQSVIKVSSTDSWCKATILDDKENGKTLRITVLPNDGFTTRTAKVSVYSIDQQEISIEITQWSNEPSMEISAEHVDIIDGELSFSLTISSNYDFSISLPDWINNESDNTTIIGTKTYNFTVSAIPPSERTGEIEFIAIGEDIVDLKQTVSIKQIQNELKPILTDFSPVTAEKFDLVKLSGENFGNLLESITVFFNDKEAIVKSVSDNEIIVEVPQSPGEICEISVLIEDNSLLYETKFNYRKSWSLSTLTGNGNSTFKAGTLAEGQIKARYLAIDDNNNIFANHRDSGNDQLYIVKINEEENSIVSLTDGPLPRNEPFDINKDIIPNAPTVGPNNVVYIANDMFAGESYYTLDPKNNWELEPHVITYADSKPISSTWTYRIIHHTDGYLYYFAGNSLGQIYRINPETNEGEVFYEWGAHPYAYAYIFDPNDSNTLYGHVNGAGIGYGPWSLDISNTSNRFVRLNSAGSNSAATSLTLNDGDLTIAGFGRAWQMEFGKDGYLYVSDASNHVIRKINLETKIVETIIGIPGVKGTEDGKKGEATLNDPRGLVWNKDGTALYISDFGNSRIRKYEYN